jgi:hypothetical protein
LSGKSVNFEYRLQPDHTLAYSADFECGVNKIMNNLVQEMSGDEQTACECLLREHWQELYPPDETALTVNAGVLSPNSYAKRQKLDDTHFGKQEFRSPYVDCSFIMGTSVIVERLFSKCEQVMTTDRRRMHPRLFEAIVFLRENCSWWDEVTVQEMVAGLNDVELASLYEDFIENFDDELQEW